MGAWKKWAVLGGVLVSGMLIGAVVTSLVLREVVVSRVEQLRHRDYDVIAADVINRLGRKLDLTASQKQTIQPELAHLIAELDEVRQDVRPRIQKELDNAALRINPHLTADQQQRLQEMLARLRQIPKNGAPTQPPP